ncbi:MAG: hypothetical protein M1840_001252 [Geoglossum simile]|nr:MAG: hypothetical protein M1840_001252 [Geoglossum simile]
MGREWIEPSLLNALYTFIEDVRLYIYRIYIGHGIPHCLGITGALGDCEPVSDSMTKAYTCITHVKKSDDHLKLNANTYTRHTN